METAIFAQWMHYKPSHLHYARWKMGRQEGEVDMVMLDAQKFKPAWAVEVSGVTDT